MKVLILGASGFVGLPMARAFCRAGHQVYGTTRSAEKAQRLLAEEIHPIVGEPDSDVWHHLVPTLDVIIYSVMGDSDIPRLSNAVFDAAKQAAQRLRPAGSPKLTYIHSSSTWVHGEHRKDIVSDTTPINYSDSSSAIPQLISYLPLLEHRVTHDEVLNGIIIRPPLVYGYSGSLLGTMFASAAAAKRKAEWPATPGARMTLVHVEDMVDLYVRAAERAYLVGGRTFDAVNDFSEPVGGVLQRLVEVSGAEGYELKPPSNPWEVAVSTTTLIRPYLARVLLDWTPRKPGLMDGMEVYYAAWAASQKKS